MATIALSYTVTTQDQTRIIAAFQSEANTDVNGTANSAQVLAYIKKYVRQKLIDKVIMNETAVDIAALPVHTSVDPA